MRTVERSHNVVGRWSVDALLERYVSWREECPAVRLAYQWWGDAKPDRRRLAYAGDLLRSTVKSVPRVTTPTRSSASGGSARDTQQSLSLLVAKAQWITRKSARCIADSEPTAPALAGAAGCRCWLAR